MTLKPGGSAVTLSPWLIHTSRIPALPSVQYGHGYREAGSLAFVAALQRNQIPGFRHFQRTAELRSHGLHAVANTQRGDTHFEGDLRSAGCFILCNRGGATRQDNANRRERFYKAGIDVIWVDFVHPRAGNTERDGRNYRPAYQPAGGHPAACGDQATATSTPDNAHGP